MTDQIKLETNAAELLGKYDRLPPLLQEAVRDGLARSLIVIESRVRTRSTKTSDNSVKFTGSRGGLGSRLGSYTKIVGGQVEGAIGFRRTTGFPYELAQEFGAKAKPGHAMSIPVTAEARKAGSPRNLSGTLVMRKYGGKVMLLRKLGAFLLELVYILVKSIPPRLGFRDTVLGSVDYIGREVVASAKQRTGMS